MDFTVDPPNGVGCSGPMAFHYELFDLKLGDSRIDLYKGKVVALYRGEDAVAHVRVTTLEEANRLEEVAPRVPGKWRPNYRYEEEALSVREFEARLAENPEAFASAAAGKRKANPPLKQPVTREPSGTVALDKIRSFAEARESDGMIVQSGLTYGDCRAIKKLVQTQQEALDAIVSRGKAALGDQT